jgi:Fe-Mn family superoxide dismutase
VISLPNLPYGYDDLEPALSSRALRIHHQKHHAGYVARVNGATGERAVGSLEAIIACSSDGSKNQALLNNAGQAWNHGFFWNCMTPGGQPPGKRLSAAISDQFGGLTALRRRFIEVGVSHFGSGWVWLAADGERLQVVATHDGQSLATGELTPVLVCDLWEHAYYLDYQNDRAGFLANWWGVLANGAFAETQYRAALGEFDHWAYADGPASWVRTREAFEDAVSEAGSALVAPPLPDTIDDKRLDALLVQIAGFHDVSEEPILKRDVEQLLELDRRLKAFGKRWPVTPAVEF